MFQRWFDESHGARYAADVPPRVAAGLCPACLRTGLAGERCCSNTSLLPVAAPTAFPIIVVALTTFADWGPAALLQPTCSGPRRYPRPNQIGDGLGCHEHNGHSTWLLRALWCDLEADRPSDPLRRGRLLRALSYASLLLVEFPSENRLEQARHAVTTGRSLPSQLDSIDLLRQTLRQVKSSPVALAAVTASPEQELPALLGRISGNVRLFGAREAAFEWLLRQPRSGASSEALAPRVAMRSPQLPADGSCRVAVVDWGGDVGHRFLWGLHRETAGARRTPEGLASIRPSGQVARIEARCAPVAAARGHWRLELEPPCGSLPVPAWTGSLTWRNGGVRHATVTYETGFSHADVVVAGVGHDPASAEDCFVKVLELRWTIGVPLLLLASPRQNGDTPRHERLLERWIARGLPDTPTATLRRGGEMDAVARALSFLPMPEPQRPAGPEPDTVLFQRARRP